VQLSSGVVWVSVHDGPVGALNPKQVQGFMVLEPGQQLRLYSEGGTFDCIVSGAELEGVAP
jgi:hypothetical protein